MCLAEEGAHNTSRTSKPTNHQPSLFFFHSISSPSSSSNLPLFSLFKYFLAGFFFFFFFVHSFLKKKKDERWRDYYGGVYSTLSLLLHFGFLLSSAQRSVLSVPLAISHHSAQQSSMHFFSQTTTTTTFRRTSPHTHFFFLGRILRFSLPLYNGRGILNV